jgi:hypothetical protein
MFHSITVNIPSFLKACRNFLIFILLYTDPFCYITSCWLLPFVPLALESFPLYPFCYHVSSFLFLRDTVHYHHLLVHTQNLPFHLLPIYVYLQPWLSFCFVSHLYILLLKYFLWLYFNYYYQWHNTAHYLRFYFEI